MRYAEVILPLPLENSYTYRIPADLEESVHPGCRVVVHFGKKHYYTAIVLHVTDETPQTDYELKEIFALLDAAPIIRETQLRFWQWLASYYLYRAEAGKRNGCNAKQPLRGSEAAPAKRATLIRQPWGRQTDDRLRTGTVHRH